MLPVRALLSTLFLVLLPVSMASAQSRLPPCPSDTSVRWHDCFGTIRFNDGETYVGEWRNDKRNGQGTTTFPDGHRYVGEYRDDKRHGQGIYTFPDGEQYTGAYREGKRDGYGSLSLPSGEKYVGEWRADKRHGLGVRYARSGAAIQAGRWDQDRFAQALQLDMARYPFQSSGPVAQAGADEARRRAEAQANEERRRRQELEQQLAEERRAREAAERRDASDQGGSTGTGFAVAPGHLVTNQHVVAGCQRVEVFSVDGRRSGVVLDTDESVDLALVRVTGLGGNLAKIRRPGSLRLGEAAYAFGFPLSGLLSEGGNFTNGVVSGLRGLRDSANEFQITTPVQPGNSGGAVIDSAGHVIGVVVSKLNASEVARTTGDIPQNVNFAVSLLALADFLGRNRISVQTVERLPAVDTVQLADLARAFTHRIVCQEASAAAPARGGAGTASAPSQATGDTTVELRNQASEPIFSIFVSPVSSDQWGDDLLGQETLAVGRSFTAKPPANQGCRYDVMVQYKSGKKEEKRDQNFCELIELKFSGPGR
jgi:S1-C subfamily serine protease